MKMKLGFLMIPRVSIQVGVLLTLGMFGKVLAETAAQQPTWWKDGNPPIIDTTKPQSNKAAANIGQAKWVVSEALRALRANGHGSFADRIESDLKGPPVIVDFAAELAANKDAAYYAKQKAPLQLGFLKALAKPFYDYLNVAYKPWVLTQLNNNGLTTQGTDYWQVLGNIYYTEGGYYPWNPATPIVENKKAVTLGQLKSVFALHLDNLSPDVDNDGLPDIWEQQIIDFSPNDSFASIADVQPGDDFDNDGLTNLEEFQLATDPTTNEGDSVANKVNYTYDLVGRLTGTTGVATTTFEYDFEGNITSAE